MSDLLFENFIRTPFRVRAVRITEQNMEEVAKLVQGEVKTRKNEKYIVLNALIIPNVKTAYRGWYVTQFGDGLRCYAPKVFRDQFSKLSADGSITFTFPEDPDDPPVISNGDQSVRKLPEATEGGLTPTGEDGSGNDHPNPVVSSPLVSTGEDGTGNDHPQPLIGQVIPTNGDLMTDAERATQTLP